MERDRIGHWYNLTTEILANYLKDYRQSPLFLKKPEFVKYYSFLNKRVSDIKVGKKIDLSERQIIDLIKSVEKNIGQLPWGLDKQVKGLKIVEYVLVESSSLYQTVTFRKMDTMEIIDDFLTEKVGGAHQPSNNIQCPVCLDDFDGRDSDHFIYLICGHGICLDCLQMICRGNISREKCPLCRANITLDCLSIGENRGLQTREQVKIFGFMFLLVTFLNYLNFSDFTFQSLLQYILVSLGVFDLSAPGLRDRARLYLLLSQLIERIPDQDTFLNLISRVRQPYDETRLVEIIENMSVLQVMHQLAIRYGFSPEQIRAIPNEQTLRETLHQQALAEMSDG